MTFSDEYIAEAADSTGIPEEQLREILDRMVENGMVEVGEDGEPVPAGPLAEMLADAHREVALFAMELRKLARIALSGPDTFVVGEPLDGVLRVPRPKADPRLN